jgi:hypothetical protein
MLAPIASAVRAAPAFFNGLADSTVRMSREW